LGAESGIDGDNACVIFARGYGTSSVGCHPGKIISRKDAEALRKRCFSLRLCDFARKKLFHAKPRSRKGEATPLPFSIFQLLEDMEHLFFREAGLQAKDMNGNAEPEPGDDGLSFSKLTAFSSPSSLPFSRPSSRPLAMS